MYELPKAGRLEYEKLCKNLAIVGYSPAPLKPGILRHDTSPTLFVLVVDDFGINYKNKEDINHLIKHLKTKYEITLGEVLRTWPGRGQVHAGNNLQWGWYTKTFRRKTKDKNPGRERAFYLE